MKNILNKKGFTLLELMIVVAIIGIMTAIAIPNYLKVLPHIRLKGAVMDVSDVLQMARMKAVAKNTTYMVRFHYAPTNTFEMGKWDSVTGTFTQEQDSSPLGWIKIDLLGQGSSATLPELNDSGTPGTVIFKSDGSASVDNAGDMGGKGAVYLRNNPVNNNEEFRVVVTEITGKVNVQHLEGISWVD